MQITLKGRLNDASGFTLIEMISCVVIVGILSSVGIPRIQSTVEKARIARAIGDVRAIQADVMGSMSNDTVPSTLASIGRSGMVDPWGNAYVYYRYPSGGGGERTDQFGQPLNNFFDLYSRGKDGSSSPPIGASSSKDDIVRASNGGYIGLGGKY